MQSGSGHEQATNYPLENHLEDWLWRVARQDEGFKLLDFKKPDISYTRKIRSSRPPA